MRLTCVIYSFCTKNNETTTFNNIIGLFMHFSVHLTEDYFQYQPTDSDTDNYWLVWCQTIMTLLIKTITLVLKESISIITSVAARSIRLDVILAIMSVSTFITAVILYLWINIINWSFIIVNVFIYRSEECPEPVDIRSFSKILYWSYWPLF